MCGRYALHAHPDVIALQFALSVPPEFEPRYNIAPSLDILIVREHRERGRDHPINVQWRTREDDDAR